jgi:hypothetical protein
LRHGVALIVTMGIISVISLVVMSSFEIIQKGFVRLQNIEKLNQTRVVVRDIEQAVGVLEKEITDADMLSFFMGVLPPLSDDEGRFSMQIELQPTYRAININSILDKQNPKEPLEPRKLKEKYQPFFEYIFNTYQVKDGDLLLNYILDTLDMDIVERSMDTERALRDITRLQGLIPTKEEFYDIVKEYQLKVDDKDIFNVPWDRFFYFGYTTAETPIDCNFMSIELAEALQLEIERQLDFDNMEESGEGEDEVSCEDLVDREDDNATFKNFNISPYKKGKAYYVTGTINYTTNSVKDSFLFIYNLKTKRIVSLEINTENF